MAEDEQPFYRWLQTWVQEEAFWRDVTTRTLAAVIAGILAFTFARFAGYLAGPGAGELVAGAAAVVALLAGAALVVVIVLVALGRIPTRWLLVFGIFFVAATGPFVVVWYER